MNGARGTWSTDELRTHSVEVAKAGADRSVDPEYVRAENQGRMLIGTGIAGMFLAVLCCATPALAVLLPAVGLGAWLAGADRMLLTLLVVSLGVIALGFVHRQAKTDACCEMETNKEAPTR